MEDKFSIEKYYFDCIDDNWNVFVGYSSVLRWHNLNFNFSNYLHRSAGSIIVQHKTFLKRNEPIFTDNQLTWENKTLKVKGNWTSETESIREILMDNENGNIDWTCLQPRAISIITCNDHTIVGNGYTEKINISIKPWEMGINSLWWGRFIAEHHHLIWIKYSGANNITRIYLNDNTYNDGEITDRSILFSDGILNISNLAILRKGSIIKNLLNRFTLLKNILPESIHKLNELKYVSSGVLNYKGKIIHGQIIHEVVTW